MTQGVTDGASSHFLRQIAVAVVATRVFILCAQTHTQTKRLCKEKNISTTSIAYWNLRVF